MRNNAHRKSGALLVACALLFSTAAAAQDSSSITGTVVDTATKKPVADVVVTATSPALPSEKIVVTDKKGTYTIDGLPAGTYTLSFEGPAYRPYTRNGVAVRVATAVKFDIELIPEEGLVEELVVTGSRIPRAEVATAAPVTVVSRTQMESSGKVNVGDFLQQSLPEQSNAINAQYNNGGDGSVRVNLRGLGSARTLTLVNGRRHVAGGTGANASVDLNTIAPEAIERIEVLKDGASAIYGSDAISGVVNIITRKDYNGTDLTLQSSTSQYGDGTAYNIGATTGVAGERGNILFSASFTRQEPVMAGDRPFSRFDKSYNWASRRVGTSGSSAIPDGRFAVRAQPTDGNTFWNSTSGSLTNQQKDPTKTPYYVFTYKNGTYRDYNSSGIEEAGGDLYNYQPENYLYTPSQRVNAYATGGTRIGETARGFFELSYTNRQSAQKLAPEPLFVEFEGLSVSAKNEYNPFGLDVRELRRRLVEFGNRDFVQDLDTFRVVTGVEGSLGKEGPLSNWTWDVALNYGRTQGVETKQGLLQRSRLAAALGPTHYDETGALRCGEAGAPIEGCIPLNLFGGRGSITKEMANSLTYTGTARGYNQQISAVANIGGGLFTLGNAKSPVGIAAGVEHRREYGASIPDPLTARGDTTGNKGEPTKGMYYVNEAYAELSVPLLARLDGSGDMFELSAATRGFNYNTFGSGATFKVGGRLSVIPDITLRGTLSNAFRAPAIADLYSGQYDSFPPVSDPCANKPAAERPENCNKENLPEFDDDRTQLLARYGGNPKLTPETANIFTTGLVIEPRVVQNLAFTVDYYNINIRDAISDVGPYTILATCYPEADGATPKNCDLIERDENGKIVRLINTNTNVGGNRTSGVDFGLRYEPMTAYGRFGFSANVAWVHAADKELADGTIVKGLNTYDLDGVYVDWRANTGLQWALDPVNAGVTVRWINGFRECEGNDCSAEEVRSRRVEGYATVDLNLGYKLKLAGENTTTITAGVTNLLNRAPAVIYNGFLAGSDASTYDYMGRQFFVRLGHSFN